MSNYTTDQILSMAPDTGSAKAGQGLASPGKWAALSCSETAVWGACQGSGSKPYEVMVDLGEPAFRCSCPSRKFPCKHGIGLMLIYANNRASVTAAEVPASVSDWFGKRGEKAEKKAVAVEAPKTEAELAKSAAQQAKRADQRRTRVAQGLDDLRLWLRDLVRQGISSLQSKSFQFWDEPAARLVDAQAPGVARMLREMAPVPASGEGWQERLLESLGLIALLLEAYDRLDSLPEPIQADVRETIGWNVPQQAVLAGEAVPDFWVVTGQRSYDEDQFRVTRTWLRGRDTSRDALSLQFTRPGQTMEEVLAPGMAFSAELVFFPGAWPMRALVKERGPSGKIPDQLPANPDFSALLDRYSGAIAHNPWISVFPALVEAVVPFLSGRAWNLQDKAGCILPMSRQFDQGYKLLAISGGSPVELFGEWDGANLLPLSVLSKNRLVTLA